MKSTLKTSFAGRSIATVLFVLAFMALWTACTEDSGMLKPGDKAASATTISPASAVATSQSFPVSTVTLGDGNNYSVASTVTWYGSTTTWTYTITAASDAKDISHVSFLGIDGCFLSNWTNKAQNPLELTQEGETGCVPDKTTQVYKSTDDANDRTKTFTFTFNKAFAVDESAGSIYVKAGSDNGNSGGGCGSVVIPGPSCQELAVSGVVTEKVCNEAETATQAAAGKTVTATQGSASYTTTTDVNGNYAFSNLGGEWVISVEGADDQLASLGPDDASVSFLIDSRTNGSCAMIIGTVTITECFEQSSRTMPYIGATATSGSQSFVTLAPDGSFRFLNAGIMAHNVTVDGVTKSVTVTADEGIFNAGEIIVDKTNGGVCGSGPVACSLSQGYWFAKPQAVWPAGSVTIGGKPYTQAEGKAIWNTSNSKGLLNAKAAFLQASAIKLSNVAPTASVWADVQIIDNYLASIAKLAPGSIPANSKTGANASAGAAAGRIGKWIDANHCAE